MGEIKALEKLREICKYRHLVVNTSMTSDGTTVANFGSPLVEAIEDIIGNIEAEIAERYMLKDDAKLDKTAVQEYNLTVHVADGQTIEYNTELRHRCGAATSMSVAFRLE